MIFYRLTKLSWHHFETKLNSSHFLFTNKINGIKFLLIHKLYKLRIISKPGGEIYEKICGFMFCDLFNFRIRFDSSEKDGSKTVCDEECNPDYARVR